MTRRAVPDSSEQATRRSIREAEKRRRSARRPDESDSSTERHASSRGDRFTHVLTWTTVGTLIPGAGLIAAGRRVLGGVILAVFIVGLAVIAGIIIFADPMEIGLHLAVSPAWLTTIAIVCAVLLLIWAAIIVASYVELKRPLSLQSPQRVLGGVLVVCMLAFAAMPTGLGAFYSLTERSLLTNVFGNSGPIKKHGPNVAADDPWEDMPHINVLLLGSDAGKSRIGTRPDTLMVASIDTHTGETKLIGIPRNLDFPIFPKGTKMAKKFPDGFNAFGKQQSMINSVWTWAAQHPQYVDGPKKQAGLTATTHAVEGSLGLSINYFALVNLQGFEDVVNSIGGVDINVNRKIPIGGGHDLGTGGKYPIRGYIQPGQQHLDGFHALWYVRSREGSNNYDRMCRQQRMIKTVLGRSTPPNSPWRSRSWPALPPGTSRPISSRIS